jgi:hypothetical protein
VWGGRCISLADDKQLALTRPGPTWRSVASRASPGLLQSSGHVLRRQPEGRGAGLSADLHRHLHQGGLRQTLRSQGAEAADLLNDCAAAYPISVLLRGGELSGRYIDSWLSAI